VTIFFFHYHNCRQCFKAQRASLCCHKKFSG